MYKATNVDDIVNKLLPNNCYFTDKTTKKQIVLHHSVSGNNPESLINTFKANASKKISTHFAIDRDGKIYQFINSKYWAHHLGTKKSNNTSLNKSSISIELLNWGGLTEKNGKLYTAYDKELKNTEISEYPKKYRGYKFFEKYTDVQLKSAAELITLMANKYNIPLDYKANNCELSDSALNGTSGVYTHTNYRSDKSDCHPQEELIDMLKNLK